MNRFEGKLKKFDKNEKTWLLAMQFPEIWHGCVKVHLKINNSLELVQDCKRFAVFLETSQLCKTTPEAC